MTLVRTTVRVCAAIGIAAALIVMAVPASAHVTVASDDAEPGGFGKLVFRVPTESETASTTQLRITLPEDQPFAFVNAQSVPGWNVEVKKEKHDEPIKAGNFTVDETVSQVVWTADKDNGIKPDEFAEFGLSVGPLPDKDNTQLVFEADQKYSDGTTVSWDERQAEGENEPEHPAPTLMIGPSDNVGPSPDADHTSVQTLPLAALLVAIVALIVSIAVGLSGMRGRRQ